MESKYVDTLDNCFAEILQIEAHIDKDKFNSLNAFLIAYAVIRACGTIESVYKNLVADVLSTGATSEAVNYIDKNIRESSSNPSTGNIARLLQDLNNEWVEKFNEAIHDKHEKGSLNSLVNLRNDYAHGRSAAPTIANVKQYYEDARTIVTWLNGIICLH